MVGRLWEAFSYPVGNIAPLVESELDLLGVLTLFPRYSTQERDNMLGQIVLNC